MLRMGTYLLEHNYRHLDRDWDLAPRALGGGWAGCAPHKSRGDRSQGGAMVLPHAVKRDRPPPQSSESHHGDFSEILHLHLLYWSPLCPFALPPLCPASPLPLCPASPLFALPPSAPLPCLPALCPVSPLPSAMLQDSTSFMPTCPRPPRPPSWA